MTARRRSSAVLFVSVLTAVAAAVFSGCEPAESSSGANAAGRTDGGDGRSRVTIRLLANDHPWIHHTMEHLSDFTRDTGIIVEVDVYPEEQFRAKRTVEMLSGISEFDLFMIMPGNSLSEYHHRGWVEPLDRFIDDPSGTAPSPAVDDFFPAALAAGVRNDRHYSIPILLETSILAYNREIFDRYGLDVPRTMAELEETARAVHEQSEGEIYGITMRGRGASATSQWADFLHSFGGSWVDREGNAAIHAPESLAALETYGRLLRRYGPRDATGNGWYESLSIFMRGEAAMIFDANVFRNHYEDPEQSEIAGSVGYAMLPAGPAGSVPHISHWGLAIYPGSDEKEAAWRFISWAAGREQALDAHRAAIPSALQSVWEDPDVTESEDGTQWIDASTGSYAVATHRWNPPVIEVDEARTAVGEAVIAAILDEGVPAVAEAASRRIDRLQKTVE
ncbi:MAG: ABC transporter substrate-binding protein [Spirochaetota bacterium]